MPLLHDWLSRCQAVADVLWPPSPAERALDARRQRWRDRACLHARLLRLSEGIEASRRRDPDRARRLEALYARLLARIGRA